MKFFDHSKLKGLHAFLGASKYAWLHYSDDKLVQTYRNSQAAQRGTEIHEFAASCIHLGQKLPRSHRTLNMYVNDAIGFKMTPEQVLYYSDNCFGTADSISFRNNVLRIHDLKTGSTPASMEQLLIYSALFCLEYNVNPKTIQTELRIYQLDDVQIMNPEPELIMEVCDKIKRADKILNTIRSEEE